MQHPRCYLPGPQWPSSAMRHRSNGENQMNSTFFERQMLVQLVLSCASASGKEDPVLVIDGFSFSPLHIAFAQENMSIFCNTTDGGSVLPEYLSPDDLCRILTELGRAGTMSRASLK
jgi:hypothetical protein